MDKNLPENKATMASAGRADDTTEQRTGARDQRTGAGHEEQDEPKDSKRRVVRDYNMMSLEELRELAEERGVRMNPAVEKSHLIGELYAEDTGSGEHRRGGHAR